MFDLHPGWACMANTPVYPQVALPRWQDPLGHAHNYF
jgi:hypothetical protein